MAERKQVRLVVAEPANVQARRAKRAGLIVVAVCLCAAIALAASCAVENSVGDGLVNGSTAGAEVGTEIGNSDEEVPMAGAGGAGIDADGSYVEAIWDDVMQGIGFEDAVEQAGFQKIDEANAPAWFERELAPLAVFDSVFANSEKTLFALQMPGTAENALESMCAQLAGRGWECIPSDMVGAATFNKTEGECKWAMLECSETDGTCCMVLHIQQS